MSNRYTTTQSKDGQLAGAKVIYVGSPDSPNNGFLATDNPVNVSPSSNNVTYGNRVTINPGESWYYYSPRDAQKKAEERAFIAISSHIPSMVGFSAVAGAGADAAAGAVTATADIPPVDAGIPWGTGIKAQGDAWEKNLAARMPPGSKTPPNFKTFDFFDPATGTATSAKTLDTATGSKIAQPTELYRSLVKNIDAAADFTSAQKGRFELDASQIKSRVVEVAVPSTTTPDQMRQINAAVQYGKKLGVTVNITKTK